MNKPLPPPKSLVKDPTNTRLLLIIVGSFIGLCAVCGFLSLIADRTPLSSKTASSMITAKTTKASNSAAGNKSTSDTSGKASDSDSDKNSDKKSDDEVPDLEVTESSWEKAAEGTIAVWQVTIKNNTEHKISHIKYQTRYYTEAGKRIWRDGELDLPDHIIQKVVEPNQTQSLEISDAMPPKEVYKAVFKLKSWDVVK